MTIVQVTVLCFEINIHAFYGFLGDFVSLLPVFHKYLEPKGCLCIENEFCYVNDFAVCDGFVCPSKSQRQRHCSVAYELCQ